MRLAIIGGGIAGLTAALKIDPAHEVTILEAGPRIGGHANTVDLELPGETHQVDTGFIVHNRRNYPVFCALLDELGVATQPSDMSFSVSSERSGLEFAWIRAQRDLRAAAQPRTTRVPCPPEEIARFGRSAGRSCGSRSGGRHGRCLHAHAGRLPRRTPLLLSVRARVPRAAGLGDLVGQPRDVRPVPGPGPALLHGQPRPADDDRPARVADRLRGITAICRSCTPPLHRLGPRRRADFEGPPGRTGIELLGTSGPERFDGFILAVHADQALALLGDPSDAEREVLGAIPYQRNVAVLHTDASLLPRSRRAWAAWNYHQPASPDLTPTVTYWMNRLQSLQSGEQILVTLNREEEIDPAKVHGRFEYHHPVYSRAGFAAQQRWDEINGLASTWYCGAWWGYGFHEDGAASGLRVARAIGGAR